MKSYKRVALFFICNLIGAMFPSVLFIILLQTDSIDPETAKVDLNSLETIFMGVPLMMWFVCALFSFSVFFVSRKWRPFFYLAPIVTPIAYCIYAFVSFL